MSCHRLLIGRVANHPTSPATEMRRSLSLGGCRTIVRYDSCDLYQLFRTLELTSSQNPQNWSLGKKLFASSLVWLLTFAIYIGSAIYSPGIPGVAEQFGVSTVASTLGLTLFVLGYGIGTLILSLFLSKVPLCDRPSHSFIALGPMIWSPLSELPTVGRSPVYVLTLFVFVFLNFAVVYPKNFGMLLAFRFITGFIGSPALATGGASMADIWGPRSRDYMIAIWGAFAIAAPVLGPLVGGFASTAKDWTWTIWQLIWISGFALVALFFFLPETYGPNILYRRARRLRKITDKPFFCEAELELESIPPTVGPFPRTQNCSLASCTEKHSNQLHSKFSLKPWSAPSSSASSNPSFLS